jgi:hypothetical protein
VILEYREDIVSNFEGTIVDIETIGKFDNRYRYSNDSREYQYILQVMFGYIDRRHLHILYVRDKAEIGELNEYVAGLLANLDRPLYAFNTSFERAVLFHGLGQELRFGGELQGERFEPKWRAVTNLGISNYDDPFFDKGIMCMQAWECGRLDQAVAHNRACLLKERDILLRRGFREPDELLLVS